MIDEFGDSIDRTPLGLKLERDGLPETVLSFPGKVTVSPSGDIFISDTNHNRIVRTNLNGRVKAVYGTSEMGFMDGGTTAATFNQPQGSALSDDGATLYVADTENHAVRAVDLTTGAVSTVAGTGKGLAASDGTGTDH